MPSYDVPQNGRPDHATDLAFSGNDEKNQPEVVQTGRSVAPTEASKPEQPRQSEAVEVKPQSYVWLANGDVLRANDEDLPGASGAGNPFGHWQKDGKVYDIVGVYPTETEA